MRKFLGTLVILGLILAGFGLYRGWFGVSADDQPGETNVEVTIDKQKIKQDAAAASEKVRDLTSPDDVKSEDEDGEDSSETGEPFSGADNT